MAFSSLEDRYLNNLAEQQFPTMEPVQLAAATGETMTDARPVAEIKAIPQSSFESLMEKTGLSLEQVGMELDKLGKVNIAGIEIGLRDLLPFVGGSEKRINPQTGEEETVQVGTPQALQKAGRGESLVRGTGFATQLVPDAKLAAFDIPSVGALAKTGAKGLKQVAGASGDMIASGTPRSQAGSLNVSAFMPGESIVPVKVGEREIKIPATQAAVLSKAIKNLTPAEQSKFKANTAKTFVEYLSVLPSKQEFAAAAIGGQAKRGWYEGSTQAIVNVFGPDAPRFAALLSATSPQTSVESNLFNALQVWKNWTAAGRPTDEASIIRVMGQSVQGNKGEDSVLDAWKNNTVAALTSEDPSALILSGPKVDSFMKNLQGNVNEVTNDAWMAAFALVDQKMFSGSLTKTDAGKGPGYLAMNARVRETADYLTKLTGETWTPAEVQETIWSWAKTLYETAGSAGETRSAVQLIRDSAITDELIASTPDFRTLFYDARFQPILEQAGYGEQLAKLRAATAGADGSAGGQKPRAGSKAGALDPEAQRKLNERNAKRLDKLRKQREEASAQKAAVQSPSGGNE